MQLAATVDFAMISLVLVSHSTWPSTKTITVISTLHSYHNLVVPHIVSFSVDNE